MQLKTKLLVRPFDIQWTRVSGDAEERIVVGSSILNFKALQTKVATRLGDILYVIEGRKAILSTHQWVMMGNMCILISLTSLDSGNGGQKGDGIHNALFALKPPRSQDPCSSWVHKESVKEKSRKTGKVVIGGCFFTHDDVGVLCWF